MSRRRVTKRPSNQASTICVSVSSIKKRRPQTYRKHFDHSLHTLLPIIHDLGSHSRVAWDLEVLFVVTSLIDVIYQGAEFGTVNLGEWLVARDDPLCKQFVKEVLLESGLVGCDSLEYVGPRNARKNDKYLVFAFLLVKQVTYIRRLLFLGTDKC